MIKTAGIFDDIIADRKKSTVGMFDDIINERKTKPTFKEKAVSASGQWLDPGQLGFEQTGVPAARKSKRSAIGFTEALTDRPEEKIPFSPIGAIRSVGLAQAAKRLSADNYKTSFFMPEQKGLLPSDIGYVEPSARTGLLKKQKQFDIDLLSKYFEEQEEIQERGYSLGGQVGRIVSEMPAFMIEFITTGGLQKLGSAGAKKAGRKIIGQYAETAAGKAALATGGFAVGTALRSAGMPHRAADAILKRQIPKGIVIKEDGSVQVKGPVEKPFESIWKGLADHYIEIASEQAGEAISPAISKVFGKLPFMGKMTGALQKQWLKLNPNKSVIDFTKKISTQAGFNGVISEVGEEYLGDATRAIVGVDDFGAGPDASVEQRLIAAVKMDTENLPAMVIAFAIPGAARIAPGLLASKGQTGPETDVAEPSPPRIGAPGVIDTSSLPPISAERQEQLDAVAGRDKNAERKAARVANEQFDEDIQALDDQAAQHLASIAQEALKPKPAPNVSKEQEIVAPVEAEQVVVPGDKEKVKSQKVKVETPQVTPEVTPAPAESKIDKIRKKVEEREAGQTDEQLSGITKKRRRSLIKETAERIKGHDIYQTEVEAQDVSGRQIGPGFYYVHESGRGEVEAIIPPKRAKDFKKRSEWIKYKKLMDMFTFDRADLHGGGANAWDTAIQEGFATEVEGTDEWDTKEMDLSEFVQRVKDAHESGRTEGILNKAALEGFSDSGYPDAEMLAEKYRMLSSGASDIEINGMIAEWAERNDIPVDSIADEFVNAEKMKKIAELSEENQDAELERLATEQIIIEDQIAAQQAAIDVLEANDIKAEVRTVEEIQAGLEKVREKDVSRGLLGQEVGRSIGGKQKDLGIGKGTKTTATHKPELRKAISEKLDADPKAPTTPAAMLKWLKEHAGWEGLFNNYLKPDAEMESAWDEAVLGQEFKFQRRGRPTGAAMTIGQRQVILLAYGADVETGYHEGWHLLRGLLTDKDKDTLEAKFGKGLKGEEAEAAAFGRYAKTNKTSSFYVKVIFDKIRRVLDKIRSALTGKGFRTADDIFGQALTGTIAKIEVQSKNGVAFEIKLPEGYETKEVQAPKRRFGVSTIETRILITTKGFGTVGYADNYEQAIEKAWQHKTKQEAPANRAARTPEGSVTSKIPEAVTDPYPQQAKPPQIKSLREAPESEIHPSRKTGAIKKVYADDYKGQELFSENFEPPLGEYATGDVVTGDIIQFTEGVFGGRYKKPKFIGDRTNIAKVVKDSYGRDKQQHTFTIEIIKSEGESPLETGKKTTRKGRNVYRNGTQRLTWRAESKREAVATEKHKRGDRARVQREIRRADNVKFETSGQRMRREAEQRGRINARKARLKAQMPTVKRKKKSGPKIRRLKIKLRESTPPLRADLAPVEKGKAEIPGQAYITPEPAPGKGRSPKRVILTDSFLDQNRKKYRLGIRHYVSERAADIMLGFDKTARAMSTRLERIAPELKYAVRRYVYNVQTRTVDMVKEGHPMLMAWKKFSKDDKRDFKFAALNSWPEKVQEIVEKYGCRDEYERFRAMMDEIYQAGNSVGLEIMFDAEHWPRKVKNFKGLIKYLMTTDKWSPIQQALFKRQEMASGRELTDDEKAQVINSLLRGFRVGGVTLSRPGAAKERTIEVFDNKIEPYYHEFEMGIQIYIQDMMQAIAAREFFGKETKEIRDMRAQKARLATRLYKTSKRIGYKKPITQENYDTHISAARKQFTEVSEKLAAFKSQTIEDSIGWEVQRLFLEGRIDYEQQQQIAGMFKAIFEPRGMSGAVKMFTKLAYIDVLANPEVAMTQLEEMGLSVYRNKIKSVPALTRAFTGTSKIKLHDIGVDAINQYMQDLGFHSLGDKLLFMLRATDMAGKEAYVNTAVEEYRSKAKRSTAAFRAKMKQIFGEESGQVIEDLKAGTVSENVKFLAFSELADMQPIAVTETPQYYARGGNHRIWYMLRQFTLRRLDRLLVKARAMMVNPASHPGQFVKGFTDIMHYLAILTAFGVGKDVLRAWFHGKPFDEEDFKDSVIDNLLQFVLLSRWTAMRAKKEGLGAAVAEEIVPPTKGIDAIINDVKKGEIDRTVRSVPIVGEPYYWWFGGGRRRLENQGGNNPNE